MDNLIVLKPTGGPSLLNSDLKFWNFILMNCHFPVNANKSRKGVGMINEEGKGGSDGGLKRRGDVESRTILK